jgi:hypothetical protein
MAGNTLIQVTGTYTDAGDAAASGTVSFTPMAAAVDTTPSSRQVTMQPVIATLDAAGKFAIGLIASDDAGWRTEEPVAYQITEKISGLDRKWWAYLNGPGPIDLTSLTPATTPPPVVVVPVPGPEGPEGPQGPQGEPGSGIVDWTNVPDFQLHPTIAGEGILFYDPDHPYPSGRFAGLASTLYFFSSNADTGEIETQFIIDAAGATINNERIVTEPALDELKAEIADLRARLAE